MTVTVKKSFKEVKADEGMWILNKISRAIAKKFCCGLKVSESKYREITNEEKEAIEAELRELEGDEYPGD